MSVLVLSNSSVENVEHLGRYFCQSLLLHLVLLNLGDCSPPSFLTGCSGVLYFPPRLFVISYNCLVFSTLVFLLLLGLPHVSY